MVSKEYIDTQLKKIDFKVNSWGRGEVNQLPNIILPDEEIYEVVNGLYEGGFALLVATDIRVLLVDKKPMSFLTVEDLRFDMINEIDYNHRLMGAYITISTGNKTLSFRSYNKPRLRKLIGHVQHCMAETKKKQSSHVEDQSQHLEQLNQQLQAYLVAQYKQQQKLHDQLAQSQTNPTSQPRVPEPMMPPEELQNFLYAQGLLDRYKRETGKDLRQPAPQPIQAQPEEQVFPWSPPEAMARASGSQLEEEIYADGRQEVFGKQNPPAQDNGLDVNPIKIAISKLPLALRSRKFGLPKPSLPVYRGPTPRIPKIPPQPEPMR